MTRRQWILAASGLSACSRRPKSKTQLLPQTIAGVWHLKDEREVPPSDTPGVRRLINALYDGPGTVLVDIYEMGSPAGGLEMVQRWRPVANTVVFYKGRYFAAVKWEQVDRKALQEFVRGLEQQLDARP